MFISTYSNFLFLTVSLSTYIYLYMCVSVYKHVLCIIALGPFFFFISLFGNTQLVSLGVGDRDKVDVCV